MKVRAILGLLLAAGALPVIAADPPAESSVPPPAEGCAGHGLPRQKPGELLLVHLRTDGSTIVMPRYHSVSVGEDTAGRRVIPASPEDVWWLPCGTHSLARRVQFSSPSDGFEQARGSISEERLANHPDFYFVAARHVRPRLGIAVDAVAELVKERQAAAHSWIACEDGA
jgi:hypothetical protein